MAKILLVEDEINIASFIERGLQEFGHEVCVANVGAGRLGVGSAGGFPIVDTRHHHAEDERSATL